MNRGYIHLWRKFLDGGYVQNHKLCAFMIWSLLKASHKRHEVVVGRQRLILEPGQFIFGRKKATEETGLSEQEIRTIITFLTKINFLTSKSTNKFSVITIINFPIYQGKGEDNQPAHQPATNQPLTTNNNVKNKNIYCQNSLQVISFLNEKTGKRFRDTSQIEARLKEGGTVEDCKTIIENKLRDPFFVDNPRHLNPVTLFRKGHWDTYLNDTAEVKKAKW